MANRTAPIVLADTGETLIIADWKPDPLAMEADIIKIADSFDNWAVPLQETRELLIEDTREHFKQERDPDGRKWIPLEAEYALEKQKAVGEMPILQREGRLYEAATSEEAWLITEDAVVFNPEVLPTNDEGHNYGAINQAGSGPSGTTTYHRLMRRTPESLAAIVQQKPEIGRKLAAFQTGEGKGNNLPARPFIGASEETIIAIEAAFLRHMENTIEGPWKEIGGGGGLGPVPPVEMGSNVLGTFPIIGYTKKGQPMLRTPHGVRFGRRP